MQEQLPLFTKSLSEAIIPPAIRDYPKIDLHRHLLGSVSAEMVFSVAKEHNLPLPTRSLGELEDLLTIKEPVNGLRPYFRPWTILSKLLVAPDIISSLVYHVLRDAYKDNVIYTELRVAWGMTGKEPFTVKEFLRGLQVGLTLGQQEYGVVGRIVFGITRHLFARHTAWQRRRLWFNILEAINQYRESVVVGFDLSGIEEGYPARLFMEEFQQVQGIGLPVTIHCGETTGIEDVRETLEILHPSRISHALSAVSDEKLLERLAILQIPIEVCPTSNYHTRAVADLTEHPMKKMYASGIKLTVNTDNPAISKTTLSREFSLLASKMGFSMLHIRQFTENSVVSIFGNDSLRQTIEEKYKCLKDRTL